ncbi:M56 family metallopeptidase [Singulisphaera sp. PoT]|uniref:M56 family metallopeptidase n=1 Tax=Singulisphaera sp. PoT TaxID=3411797 RepID=UPI003BF6010B
MTYFVFTVLLRATILLGLAWAVCSILRRQSASLRHLIWLSSLTAVLILPVLMGLLPTLRLPILPSRYASQAAPVSLDRTEIPEPKPSPVEPPHVSPAFATPVAHELVRAETNGLTSSPILSPVPAANAVEIKTYFITKCIFLLQIGWAGGALIVLMPMLTAQVRLRRVLIRSQPLNDAKWTGLIEQLGSWLRLSRRVSLLCGGPTTSPMTWGVLRPKVLIPSAAEEWSQERLKVVLLHELAHVKRWDCLAQMFARVVCAVYWFHPLVWVASNRLRVEREKACDDLVLLSGSSAADYAEHLLEVARSLRSAPRLAAVAVPMARASQIEGRLLAILDRRRRRHGLGRLGAFGLLATVGLLLLSISTTRLAARIVNEAGDDAKREATQASSEAKSTRMTVSGRVVDESDKPVAGTKVLILGRRKLAALNARSENQYEVMGRTETDANGNYRVEVRRSSSVTHYEIMALASAPGHGLGFIELNRDAPTPSANVKLKPEQVVEGRLVDLEGAPASDTAIRVSAIGLENKQTEQIIGINFWRNVPKDVNGIWPEPLRTNGDGRFRIHGIARRAHVSLEVDSPRYARQYPNFQMSPTTGSKPITLSLQPAMTVSGRVTHTDTGTPMENAIVEVEAGNDRFSSGRILVRTDAEGRYTANSAPGKFSSVTVYPPIGTPYLIFERNFEDDGDAMKRIVDMKVPRGVLITGRITSSGNNRSLSGSSLYYMNGEGNVIYGEGTIPNYSSAVLSDSEGRYAIAVKPGKGYLVCYGPTADFVHEIRGDRDLDYGKPGGQRNYAHAFKHYDVKAGQHPLQMDIAYKPGVTVTGTVVGPNGETVESAEIITTLSISPFHTNWRGDFTLPVREGRFELHGVPPDRAVKCSFLDAKNGWGTTIEVTGAMAAKGPLNVRLEPCGTATVRVVNPEGKPVERSAVTLTIVATPGPGEEIGDTKLSEAEKGQLSADEEIYANVDRLHYWQPDLSNAEGRVTMPFLIPGATYRIYEYEKVRGEDMYRWRDFSLKAGQTIDLGDVKVKGSGG